jgi:malate dehydrogenase (oxaloacetate-decarboxylating)
LLAATGVTHTKFTEQRIVILGAGSASMGICDQIVAAMEVEGATEVEARAKLWLVDSQGLVHTGRAKIEPLKQKYAQATDRILNWKLNEPSQFTFGDVVRNVQPTVLIGTTAQPGVFTEEIVREMAKHVERPVIFPLSNPTSKSEGTPIDLFKWTDGRAVIATGSPFPPIVTEHGSIRIGQCNNSFIFPGVGLGVIASGARRVTDAMFVAAARVLSAFAPVLHDPEESLYPPLEQVREISFKVALEVARVAQRAGLAEVDLDTLEQTVSGKMWQPQYVPLRRAAP